MIDDRNNLELEIPRKVQVLDDIRNRIVKFLKNKKINKDTIANIELVVYEALINIIDHSSCETEKENIYINLTLSSSEVVIIIRNHGEEFDITKTALPDIAKHYKSGNKRGLGVYIIRTLMDIVEYRYNESVNYLTLKKYL